MASEAADTTQYQLTNLGTNVTVKDILNFLCCTNTERERKACSVAFSVKAGQNFAFVMVPQNMGPRVESCNGTELRGRMVKIEQMNENTMFTSPPTENRSPENMVTDVGSQMAANEVNGTYSAAAAGSSDSDQTHQFVELRLSPFANKRISVFGYKECVWCGRGSTYKTTLIIRTRSLQTGSI